MKRFTCGAAVMILILAFPPAIAETSDQAAILEAATAQMSHNHGGKQDCYEPTLKCATKVTPTFAPDGTLWLAWSAAGKVSVARSLDLGRTFTAPVAVNREPLDLDWGPDARPKIAVDRDDRVFRGLRNLQGQGFQRGGAVRSFLRRGPQFCGACSDHGECRKSALRGDRAGCGWIVVRGLAGQAQSRAGEGEKRDLYRCRACIHMGERSWRHHL